ncbi:hypothetical protein [Methylobacterium sp. CCH5-D2]|uniref:hypothetical protein n=1 Tax=Methylobacterium sp. CCH5-D2 TaxID=1768765 RepID=UPI000833385B|nr:hypothetical protein [Methylobacterium sp. CCH5-D2]
MLYNAPTGSTDPNAPYVGKNLAAGKQGSRIPPAAIEMTQREIVNALIEAGLSPTNDDPRQLLKAIRSGQLSTFLTSGTANDLIVTPITPHTSVYRGLSFRLFPTLQNTGDCTITTNGITKPFVRRDGTPLAPGDLLPNVPVDACFDGTAYRLLGFALSEVSKNVAAGAVTVWVRTDGNDNNDGGANLPGRAFKTITAAYTKAVLAYGIAQPVTIQLGVPGIYAGMDRGFRTAGDLTVLGDETNKASFVIQDGGNASFGHRTSGSGTLTFRGLTLQCAGGAKHTFGAGSSMYVLFYNVIFTALSLATGFHIIANDGAIVGVGDGCVFSGSMGGLWQANGGVIAATGPGLTLSGAQSYSVAAAYARSAGRIYVSPGINFAGSATGKRWIAINQGLIDTNGQGQTIIPGTTDGSASAGGLLV